MELTYIIFFLNTIDYIRICSEEWTWKELIDALLTSANKGDNRTSPSYQFYLQFPPIFSVHTPVSYYSVVYILIIWRPNWFFFFKLTVWDYQVLAVCCKPRSRTSLTTFYLAYVYLRISKHIPRPIDGKNISETLG